jgi:hypothetical protein
LPDRLIAQAHTHGDHLDPKPSLQDISISQRLKIPVYILSRKGVWRAIPDGSVTLELGPSWFRKNSEACVERLLISESASD